MNFGDHFSDLRWPIHFGDVLISTVEVATCLVEETLICGRVKRRGNICMVVTVLNFVSNVVLWRCLYRRQWNRSQELANNIGKLSPPICEEFVKSP
ncbi:hypothetical protein MTR_4g007270 [Medicago truncatula]|uniref:Uncharacterized protein n=1 Tax=Medicago truncatula TaxID=3880 RepID=G7JEH3_MEDTR|nr:hypothetical protein MTR_4g007270 [Medicago truncatula]